MSTYAFEKLTGKICQEVEQAIAWAEEDIARNRFATSHYNYRPVPPGSNVDLSFNPKDILQFHAAHEKDKPYDYDAFAIVSLTENRYASIHYSSDSTFSNVVVCIGKTIGDVLRYGLDDKERGLWKEVLLRDESWRKILKSADAAGRMI